MPLGNMSIQRKLMVSFLAISSAVLFLACASFIAYEVVALRQGMIEGYTTRAQILAANSAGALAFSNQADSEEVLAALRTDKRTVAACLYDDKGKVFAKYPTGSPNSLFPPAPGVSGYRNGFLEVFCPVVQNNRQFGTAFIKSDLTALSDRYRVYAGLSLAIIAGSLLAAYMLARLLQRQISRPILALTGTALAVTREGDFSVRAQKRGEDELGTLTNAFNRMLDEIQDRERSLKASEAAYREIFEKVNDALYIHELGTGRVLDVNARVTELLGFTREEILSGDPGRFVSGNPGFTLEEAQGRLQKAAEGEPQLFEWQALNKKGEIQWVEVSLKRATLAGQDRILALVRDIGERKRTEEMIKSQNLFLSAVNAIKDYSVIILDPQGVIRTWNEGAESIKGYQASEVLGKNFEIFYPPESIKGGRPKRNLEIAAREGRFEEEGERVRKDGSHFMADLVIRPIRDAAGELAGFIKVTRDITEQKKQQELRTYAKALEVSNKELQDFVFVASHDLQEPLRKIQSFGEFLQREEGEKLGEDGRGYLDRMRNAAGRMQRLINDLLALTRVTTKAQPFVRVELDRVLAEVLGDLETRIHETGAKIEASPLPVVEADPTQMRQMFQNLIGNALKFHRPGVPPVVRITGTLEKKDGGRERSCRITVEDNGIGFESQYADQIFKVFERLHGKDIYEGTGIGLSICRKVVERHGGKIWAEGKPGQGSRFIWEIPAR